MNSDSTYWSLPLSRAEAAGRLSIGGSETIFCERTQALFSLNATAARIWSVLEATGSCAAAAADLIKLGASAAQARAFVGAAAADWLQKGYFFPKQAWSLVDARPYQVGPMAVHLRYFGNADPRSGDELLGCFPIASGGAVVCIDVCGIKESDYIFADKAPLGMHARADSTAIIKALVTEKLCANVHHGFLMHGALLSICGKTVVLAGEPGAGKTTLALALAASGSVYGGDDIIIVDDRGFLVGLPFAAATKEGAWPLLKPYVPGIMDLQVRRRADGKHVRYVRPNAAPTAAQRPDALLLLTRQSGAAPSAALIDPLDALRFLIDGSFSHRGRIAKSKLDTFASAVSGARCARFTYSELEPAIAAVKAFVDG